MEALCLGLIVFVVSRKNAFVLGVKGPDCLDVAEDLADLLQRFSWELLKVGSSGDLRFSLTSSLRIRKGKYQRAEGVGEDEEDLCHTVSPRWGRTIRGCLT